MGIRMLNRRPARAQARAEAASVVPPAPMPAFAVRASTARIPTDLSVVARRTAADLRRRLRRLTAGADEPPAWRLWAGLGRSYMTGLAGRVARLGRIRTTRTVTVFTVYVGTLTDRPDGRPPR